MFFNSVKEWIEAGMPFQSYILGDCAEGMAAMPDKFFDLAIVDPPYGLKISMEKPRISGRWNYTPKSWDNNKPDKEYFIELFRISKNQIIWGGNYFELPSCRGFVIWDKMQSVDNFADCEFAWTSFDMVAKIFKYSFNKNNNKIHITQKPVALYRRLLQNYANPGDKLIDTHVGSASSLIAFEMEGYNDYVGFELDPDYFRDSCKRLQQWRKSKTIDIFKPEVIKPVEQSALNLA